MVLVFASAGVVLLSGIKIPYVTFFAQDSGIRVKEAPGNMLVAMAITAFLCIFIGVFPGTLYAILPYSVDYAPYTVAHVITQLQLVLFPTLAFAALIRMGLYPPEIRSTVLNSDWLYRRLLPRMIAGLYAFGGGLRAGLVARFQRRLERFIAVVFRTSGPEGILARTVAPGATSLWVAVLLGLMLILYYI